MTSVNLEILTNRAAYGSIHGGELTGKADKEMRDAGFTAADAHDIGDMIRKSELTVNAYLSNLPGWRKGQDPKNPPLFQPGYSLVNTFVSKEQKNIAKDANSYLVRRNQIEKHFFPEYGSMPQFEGRDRPNYAAFNLANGVQGAAPNYGGVVFVMKEHVKQQATYTLSDTFFAIKFDFTKPEECKARFLESAGKYLSKFVKPEVVAQLADPSTAAGAALEYFFRLYAASGVITGKGLESDNRLVQIEDFLNANRIEGARKIDKDDLMAVLFDAIGVKEDGASRVAGYDNIENLLAGPSKSPEANTSRRSCTGRSSSRATWRKCESTSAKSTSTTEIWRTTTPPSPAAWTRTSGSPPRSPPTRRSSSDSARTTASR